MKCKSCGSFAINSHLYGRESDVDLNLCDVCYWRKRATDERERCARLVEQYTGAWDDQGYALAQAIRGKE